MEEGLVRNMSEAKFEKSSEEKKREREFEELFDQFLGIASDMINDEWKRTIDSLRELANEAMKNRNEEDREEAFWLLRDVVRMFVESSGNGYDFDVHFDKYFRLYDKEFNKIIGNYTHLRHYFKDNGIVTDEYIYDHGEENTFGRCVRVIKHLYITYRLKVSRGHLVDDIYHIKGETERIESKCEAEQQKGF
jgi:hypothetical protein